MQVKPGKGTEAQVSGVRSQVSDQMPKTRDLRPET